jgi:hypothetical protein
VRVPHHHSAGQIPFTHSFNLSTPAYPAFYKCVNPSKSSIVMGYDGVVLGFKVLRGCRNTNQENVEINVARMRMTRANPGNPHHDGRRNLFFYLGEAGRHAACHIFVSQAFLDVTFLRKNPHVWAGCAVSVTMAHQCPLLFGQFFPFESVTLPTSNQGQ